MDRRSISKLCGSSSRNAYLSEYIGEIQAGIISLQQFGLYRIYNLAVGAQSDWQNQNITFRGGFPPVSTIKHQDTGSVHAWAASAQQIKDFLQTAIQAFPVTFNGQAIANQTAWDAAPLIAQDVDQRHTNILIPSIGSAIGAYQMPVTPEAFAMTKIFCHSVGATPSQIPTDFYFSSTQPYILLFAFSVQQPIGQFITTGDTILSGVTATVSFNLERIG